MGIDKCKVLRYTLYMNTLLSRIDDYRAKLDAHLPFPKDFLANIQEWLKIELTYTSNAIEGNTLTRNETAIVVNDGLTVEGKTLREHIEAVNHARAFDWIIQEISTKNTISEHTILSLHQHILDHIDDMHAGRYRSVPVRIAGSTVILPNAAKVPDLMHDFMIWFEEQRQICHPVTLAIDAHYKLVSIHPFTDGNGRTARLLMNAILMQAGYPPAIIRKEDRKDYLASIERGQLGHPLSQYYTFMYTSVLNTMELYLHTLEQKVSLSTLEKKTLLKIGEVAKLADEPIPTIRYWTKEHLLRVADHSKGGYQLYEQEAVDTARNIRKLQKTKRFTLKEIKRAL